MVEIKGIKFDTSIGVLFALKEKRGHKVLQETYNSISKTDMDNMLDVLCVCYGKGNNCSASLEEFVAALSEHGIGFIKITQIFMQVLEKILYDGMSEEEIAESKKQIMSQLDKK